MDPKKDIAYHDPNKNKENKKTGSSLICQYCNAVYQEKHWQPFEKMDPKLSDQLAKSCCPACHMKHEHISDGVLHLTGSFMEEHKDEISNLIENTAQTEEGRDFMNRVERIDHSEQGKMVIYTTKNQLAVEIGKKVDSAFKGGELKINFSKDDKPVDVRWHKDTN